MDSAKAIIRLQEMERIPVLVFLFFFFSEGRLWKTWPIQYMEERKTIYLKISMCWVLVRVLYQIIFFEPHNVPVIFI